MSDEAAPLVAEEGIKRASNNLRGELLEDLGSSAPNLSGPSEHLLKFHGIYAQDNRDVRRERAQAGETLDQIAARTGVPSAVILSASKLTTDSVGPGDVILIPDQSAAAAGK